MPTLNLKPIGTQLVVDEASQHNKIAMQKLDEVLLSRRQAVQDGWGEKYKARVHEKGKLTTRERLALLIDEPDALLPLGTFINDGETFGEGADARTSPNAGVITAFAKVCGRWVMAIANENTVASGSWWPRTPEKIIRAQEIALKLSIPVIYLVDCSGLFLPEQARSFPGARGAGHIFKMNALLSDKGVPQLAAVMGDCIAGGGYMPIISDKVVMTEQAYMVIAGAALIQGAKSQNLSSLDIGGAHVHVHQSNCADVRVPDDASCMKWLRNELQKLPSSACAYYRNGTDAAEPDLPQEDLAALVPLDTRQSYAIKEVIARLVDDSLFLEMWPTKGQEIVTGIARIAGLYVGIAANVQELSAHPEKEGAKRPGGILYREGVAKLSAFSRACNDDGIPLVWLQDVSGFDVGLEAERQGLLAYGSSLIYANSTNTTPMMTVLLRKASGAGYYAMAGLPYDPVLQLATPLSRLAVMEGRTLAIGAFNSKLDDSFNIVAKDKKERAHIEAGMKAVAQKIEADMDPYKAASQMDVDEIVALSEMRRYLACVLEASYQSQGVRRIKNPRIWSLHDLLILDAAQKLPATSQEVASNHVEKAQSHGQEKGYSIRSPMDGMFYKRPAKDAPCFVNEGDVLQKGQQIGLIEVMKCFYPLRYEGEKARRLKQWMIEDASALSLGEAIAVCEEG